jgi:phosphatidylglycerol:prolipoprotein diacylglycerol transferase
LIPEIVLPEIPLLPFVESLSAVTIKPFGLLVALGVLLGAMVAGRMARARGIPYVAMSRFIFMVAITAFISGHVLDALFYHPDRVRLDPLILLRLWDGLSSFGGFVGALLGVFLFKWWYKVKHVLPFVDVMGAAFPVGWTFGRMGCAVVHDHKGIPSDLWFAVAFERGGQFDLGLLEAVFAFVLALVCLHLARAPRPPGFFLGLTMLVYGPIRFAMDFLRATPAQESGSDPRYLALTPAQWGSIVMVTAGFAFLWYAASSKAVGNEPFRAAARDADPALLDMEKDDKDREATTT